MQNRVSMCGLVSKMKKRREAIRMPKTMNLGDGPNVLATLAAVLSKQLQISEDPF